MRKRKILFSFSRKFHHQFGQNLTCWSVRAYAIFFLCRIDIQGRELYLGGFIQKMFKNDLQFKRL